MRQLNLAFNELVMDVAQVAVLARLREQGPGWSFGIVTKPQFVPETRFFSAGTGMTLEWVAEAGVHYSVWHSEDPGAWNFVRSVVGVTSGDVLRMPLGVPKPKGFYRVVVFFP